MFEEGSYINALRKAQLVEVIGDYKPNTAVYVGIDPNHFSLHVGHLYVLLIMEGLRLAGHEIYVVLGDFTVKVGDPSERSTGRNKSEVKPEVLRMNTLKINRQIKTFFPHFHTLTNSTWLEPLSLIDFLRLSQYYSVNEINRYKYFVDRFGRGDRVSLSEVNYKVLQAYDFLHLNRSYSVKGQVGGSDQRNNIAGGFRLIKGQNCFGILINLVVNEDGTKISKSNSQPQPFLDTSVTHHLNFYRSLVEIDALKVLYPYLGCVNHEQLLLDVMRRRGWKGDSLKPLLREGIQVFARGTSLAQVLVRHWGMKNLSTAKNFVQQGVILVNGESVKPSHKLEHREVVSGLGKKWEFIREDLFC